MAFIDWLRRQHEESARNQALFEGRPRVAASEAWGGYQDSPGGQRLMVRQRERPKIDNTLTIKDDGTRTHVKKWTDPDERTLRATALPRELPINMQPIGPNYTGPWGTGERIPAHVPRMRGDIGSTQSIGVADPDPRIRGMRPIRTVAPQPTIQSRVSDPMNTRPGTVGGSLHHPARLADVSNQRAMYHALRRPNPQVAHIPSVRGNIGATQSIGVPNEDPRMRGMRPSIMNTGNWSDNLGNWYMNWRQRMIEADRRRRQRGNY